MAAEPVSGEGAPGDDREALCLRLLERCSHQLTAQSPTLEFVRHPGVDEDETLAVQAVDELGQVAVDVEFETPGRGVVDYSELSHGSQVRSRNLPIGYAPLEGNRRILK